MPLSVDNSQSILSIFLTYSETETISSSSLPLARPKKILWSLVPWSLGNISLYLLLPYFNFIVSKWAELYKCSKWDLTRALWNGVHISCFLLEMFLLVYPKTAYFSQSCIQLISELSFKCLRLSTLLEVSTTGNNARHDDKWCRITHAHVAWDM